MRNGILKAGIVFFLLSALLSAEAELIEPAPSFTMTTSLSLDDLFPVDTPQDEDFPTDAEEDTTEKREIDEYDNDCNGFGYRMSDRLLNLHYTYQHLLFKEHFADAVVPPPKA